MTIWERPFNCVLDPFAKKKKLRWTKLGNIGRHWGAIGRHWGQNWTQYVTSRGGVLNILHAPRHNGDKANHIQKPSGKALSELVHL